MTGDDHASDPLTIARAYHRGWTAKRFGDAFSLLAPSLAVEVPINDYPTRHSFQQAVTTFAGMTRAVTLLCELGGEQEAMLLYDMEVEHLGMLRVAEHFTVERGLITRIRQIHDTFPVRAAGLAKDHP